MAMAWAGVCDHGVAIGVDQLRHVALNTIDVVVLGTLDTLEIAADRLAIVLFNQLRTTGWAW